MPAILVHCQFSGESSTVISKTADSLIQPLVSFKGLVYVCYYSCDFISSACRKSLSSKDSGPDTTHLFSSYPRFAACGFLFLEWNWDLCFLGHLRWGWYFSARSVMNIMLRKEKDGFYPQHLLMSWALLAVSWAVKQRCAPFSLSVHPFSWIYMDEHKKD